MGHNEGYSQRQVLYSKYSYEKLERSYTRTLKTQLTVLKQKEEIAPKRVGINNQTQD